MTGESKIEMAILKLLEDTQDGNLEWAVIKNSGDLTVSSESIVDRTFIAKKKARTIRIYTYKFRSYTDEEIWHWSDDIALEVTDPNQTTWWRFPRHRAIWDLFEAVTFKTAEVDTFLDDILDED